MSDAAVLAPAPLEWKYRGATFHLAERDIECELFFQARHEGWAASRLDARRVMLGEESYRERLEAQERAMDANRYAFGGPLSLEWLTSREGFLEYALLLAQRGHRKAGGVPPTREAFEAASRAAPDTEDAKDWERLTRALIRRDFRAVFPKLVAAWDAEGASLSQGTATPTPSTGGSS